MVDLNMSACQLHHEVILLAPSYLSAGHFSRMGSFRCQSLNAENQERLNALYAPINQSCSDGMSSVENRQKDEMRRNSGIVSVLPAAPSIAQVLISKPILREW